MKPIILFVLILLITFSSCTVYKEYAIEVYKPGEIAVPPNVENVALVYRNFKYSGDKYQHLYKDDGQLKKAKNDPANLDSILVSYTLKELAGKKLPALKFDLINKITSETETDLLISLETFSYFFAEYSADQGVPKSREVITAAVWAVYNPDTEKIIERKTMIDTVFWNSYDEKGNYQKSAKLPPRLMALKVASQMVGENYSKRFFASWQTVQRMYSVPSPSDFTDASNFVEKGDWDNAIKIWMKYAPDKNGKLAIEARYNLALAYEMKDDILTAWKWLTSAHQLAVSYKNKESIKMIEKYQKVLAKRKKDIDRLNEAG